MCRDLGRVCLSCAMRQNTFRCLIQTVLHDSRRRAHKNAGKPLKRTIPQAASCVALGHEQWKAWPGNCRYSDASTVVISDESSGASRLPRTEGLFIRGRKPLETFYSFLQMASICSCCLFYPQDCVHGEGRDREGFRVEDTCAFKP